MGRYTSTASFAPSLIINYAPVASAWRLVLVGAVVCVSMATWTGWLLRNRSADPRNVAIANVVLLSWVLGALNFFTPHSYQ